MTYVPATKHIAPGLMLAILIALAAFAVEYGEQAIWGRAWLEALVVAIILGSVLRSFAPLPARLSAGVGFAAKPVMEAAVALMGASVSLLALTGVGLALIGAIAVTITLTIVLGYRLGRWFGLSDRMAMLVACGNAICGNSAIAAVGPAIGADGDEVAASIGFTAVMGILVVLLVPVIATALGLGAVKGGMLAGMTVYAVPQVLAAAHPLGGVAVQVGALVKLVRVLMLGPVVASVSLMFGTTGARPAPARRRQFLPGFIVVFAALAALQSLGLIPDIAAHATRSLSLLLTVVAMAGLGLGVDMRSLASAGPRVIASVILSLAVLFAGALLVIRLLG